jgi:hypothetical protein
VRTPYSPEVNTSETCCNCTAEMVVISVLPILFGDGYEDVTYSAVPKQRVRSKPVGHPGPPNRQVALAKT